MLTAPTSYDLPSSQYGILFAPQMSTAIAASLLGAGLLWPDPTDRQLCAAPLALASTRWRVQISHFGAVQVRPGVSAFW